jgi:REP element-mobilizing transposase RayT
VEGDYKNPPPPGTYDGLLQYSKQSLKKPPVVLSPDLRAAVGQACLEQFHKENVEVSALSIGGEHAHAAVDCDPKELKQMIGRVKKVSSHRIRAWIPGQVWGQGCHPVVVRDQAHWENLIRYIRGHAGNSWVWVPDETGKQFGGNAVHGPQ